MLSGGQLEKAILRVVDGDPKTRKLPFMYNPAELTTAKSANWNRPQQKGAGSAGKPQFTGAGPQTVQMEIWFDAWDAADADVARSVMTLFEWTKPTPHVDHQEAAAPAGPGVRMGQQPDPRGPQVLPQDGQRQVRPVQARRDAGPGERDDQPRGGPGGPAEARTRSSGSRESRRSHLVGAGDSLHSVAYREYGDASLWRGIAAFNEIDDPLRVAAGTRLLVPTADEARRLASREG